MVQNAQIILVNLEDHASYCVPNPIKVFFDVAKTLKMNDFSFHYGLTHEVDQFIQENNSEKTNIIIDDLDEKISYLNFDDIKAKLAKLAFESGKNVFIFSRKATSWFDISTLTVKKSSETRTFEIKEIAFQNSQAS